MVERTLYRLALGSALAGGLVLIALALATCVSIAGRLAGPGPLPGDYELVEAGTAFAVFAFLPWCQLQRGHVAVDLFVARLGRRVRAALDAGADLLMTAAAVVLTRQLYLGLLDKARFGETTFILELPLWWAYALCLPGACLFIAVAAWCAVRSACEAIAR